ncbi:MAG TPA: TolC family protein [Cyclobacteriaceae bacterium]|nr:TolC family protein [Cyclobacteriaceae bacterium]
MIAEIYCSLVLALSPTDTLQVTIDDADRRFAQKNLMALASGYNVEATRALEIQARLYPNPVVSAEINLYDPDNKEYFHAGKTGQKLIAVEQLILLGGKRRAEMALSRQNSMISEYEFEDLLRNLKLELHSNLYGVYFNQLAVAKFNQQLSLLDSMIVSYETQATRGNIAYKEVIRLKSVYIRINNEKTNFITEILDQQEKLRVLLQTESFVDPQLNSADLSRFEKQTTVDSLITVAYDHRPDYRISKATINYANLNLQYQQKLAVPNLNLGAAYDQRGGAFMNQVGLTLSMPIPLIHRNQGNIKSAQYQVKIVDAQELQLRSQISAEVTTSWMSLNRNVQEYQKARSLYNADFTTVFNGVSENFQRRNITLLEFVDFFESYNETLVQLNHMERKIAESVEQLNYSIGYPLY